MRGFLLCSVAVVAVLFGIVAPAEFGNECLAQCNVQSSSAAASANSAAVLQNQALLQALTQLQARSATASTLVAPPPRIVSVPVVQAPAASASAVASAGSTLVAPSAVDPVALAQALASLQALSVSPTATINTVSACNLGGRSRSLSVSRVGGRLASLAAPRNVSVARSRSRTVN